MWKLLRLHWRRQANCSDRACVASLQEGDAGVATTEECEIS